MATEHLPKSGGELFIVDNSDRNWKAKRYLHEWADLAGRFDIATGYFEIGALLALDGQWQKLDKIRILMGDEVTPRTRRALLEGVVNRVQERLHQSLEEEKRENPFLRGVPAIIEAMQSGRIECRIYAKEKFHAKAYITHARQSVLGPVAMVGSSNFTLPGLVQNVELNIQVQSRAEVAQLQEWYEHHWDAAVPVTDDVLRTISTHAREYSPFEVYARALHELFRRQTVEGGAWEKSGSQVYPLLSQYQKDGYHDLMAKAGRYEGALLCDGVGLGKTFVGMMLIERLLQQRKRVVLLVPKAGREPVWENALKRHLPTVGAGGDFTNLVIFNHTDLGRGGEYEERWKRVKEMADAIVIDEAHHFRNPGLKGEEGRTTTRYRQLLDIAAPKPDGERKQLFLLTATPINNRLIDLQHMIELFTGGQSDYFKGAPLGINSLPGHFRTMEKELEKQLHKGNGALSNGAAANGTAVRGNAAHGASSNGIAPHDDGEVVETNEVEAESVLATDKLFQELVVQRSRAYVKKSQQQEGGAVVIFPERAHPCVAGYSCEKTYGRLLSSMEAAFAKDKPLFSLAIYYPLHYYKGADSSIDPLAEGRQKQVVGLIKIQFLKRFESSARAFEKSCENLLLKLLAFATKHSTKPHEKKLLERWKDQHAELIGAVQSHQLSLFDPTPDDEETEDIITPEMLDALPELDREEYKVDEMLAETFLDLDQIAKFLDELRQFQPNHDDKLQALIRLLKTGRAQPGDKVDPALKNSKVLLFTQFTDTARYLREQLEAAGLDGVDQVDGGDNQRDRGKVIRRFSPYYNESSSGDLANAGSSETRVLIATDVLSEGLNLQDATRLINYDLHWNPVRLMQRIGRVDRRLNPDVEARLLHDHPEQAVYRGTVAYWNFLPPDELESLLKLYQKVAHKTLRISKTFGIEGKKLLKPEDDFEALRDFMQAYEGTTTPLEELQLEYQKLLADDPGLAKQLEGFPSGIFASKPPGENSARAVFFCYALPAPVTPALAIVEEATDNSAPDAEWSEEAGKTAWYLLVGETGSIIEDAGEIAAFIRSTPQTPHQSVPDERQDTLKEARGKVEKHIKNSYFRSANAPLGIKPTLKCWMEIY